tara:strand:+ start:27029 stop:27535 length:507 start_codon:yes stop_codon:yes gene_type:complete
LSFRSALYLILAVVLAGCGFQPIHGSSNHADIHSELSAIKIAVIEDRVGHKLHNLLLDLINPLGRVNRAAYTLTIKTQITKTEIGLKINEETTRASLSLSAEFVLIENKSGSLLMEGSVRSVNSYNIPTSEFALVAAEKNAADRATREVSNEIKTRLSLFFAYRLDQG